MSGSNAAGRGAHDSSGLRWLPTTPAPATWVVLVTGALGAAGAGPDSLPQPLARVTETAAATAIAAAIGPVRWPKNRTSPTVTLCRHPAGQASTPARFLSITTVCRTRGAHRAVES